MVNDFGYVLKNSQGMYFCGYNTVDTQLRKAQIYHSLKYAEKTKDELNTRNRLSNNYTKDFKIVKIVIYEVD